ncbi:F-box/LRR-repeat protein 2-like [Belonocnema kinseyi]|uniref:F-box/LRR-repeat protein 2-like n=1 Tax=Belonocnema kinseyi TaxID=2817044 RepID=UPI00143DD41A|nr:F-box/LRR-repeat protein 2-like [Belonocnema kinseyi]
MGDVAKLTKEKKVKKETKFEARGEFEASGIENLPDECLIEIFQYLTAIFDRICIEIVCQRWQNLGQGLWKNFKSLDFSAKTWGLEDNHSGEMVIRSIDFCEIIKMSGSYLTRISSDVVTFGQICNLLPNIQELQLWDACSPRRFNKMNRSFIRDACDLILSWMESNGKNIKNFQMKAIDSDFHEYEFSRFLAELKQLKSLCLYECHFLDWTHICLVELPFETIREIVLMSKNKPFDHNILLLMLKKCKNLQTFGIQGCDGPLDQILQVLSSHADTLKNLKVQLTDLSNDSILLSTIPALIHLEKLDVSRSKLVTDEFLDLVSKNCKKLKYLNLYECRKVTDVGISSVCHLEKLTYFNIGELPKIRKPPLERLTNLVVLDSAWNEDIEEKVFCAFLKRATQLRALNVNECSFVSNELLNIAAETTKIRHSNHKLDLYVNDTSINLEDLSRIPPSVNLLKLNHLPVAKYGIENPFSNIDDPQVFIT